MKVYYINIALIKQSSHREEAQGKPRTRWRDDVSRLTWERLGIPKCFTYPIVLYSGIFQEFQAFKNGFLHQSMVCGPAVHSHLFFGVTDYCD